MYKRQIPMSSLQRLASKIGCPRGYKSFLGWERGWGGFPVGFHCSVANSQGGEDNEGFSDGPLLQTVVRAVRTMRVLAMVPGCRQ